MSQGLQCPHCYQFHLNNMGYRPCTCPCHKSAEKCQQCVAGVCSAHRPTTDTAEKPNCLKCPPGWICPHLPTTDTTKKRCEGICDQTGGYCRGHRSPSTDTSDWRERFDREFTFDDEFIKTNKPNLQTIDVALFVTDIKAFIEKELERSRKGKWDDEKLGHYLQQLLEMADKAGKSEALEECSKLAVQQEQRYYDAGKSEAFSSVRKSIEGLKTDEKRLYFFGDWVAETHNEKMLVNAVLKELLSTLEGK